MLTVAHFTVRELPGTLAILLAGVTIGTWWAAGGRRPVDLLTGTLCGLFIVFLVVAVLSDHDRSISRLVGRTVGETGWDLLGLIVVCVLLARAWRLAPRKAGTRR
jgi:hypothetical protein